MNRIIRTVIAAAALTAPFAASAQYMPGGPIVVTPPPGGFDLRCGTADLAPTIVDVRDFGYGQWRYVVVEVTNDGSVDFAAQPGQAGIVLTVGDVSRFAYGDILDVAVDDSVTLGGWVELPGYAAPDGEPQFGQCPGDATISARLSYDPDLGIDGDPAANDCRPNNDSDQATVPYLVQCPW